MKNFLSKLFSFIPDKTYLRIRYFLRFKKKLDLKNPKTYTEKLQWLKLYDRKPEYTIMVDKYAVKKYVADKIGEEYIIPTLGIWDKFEDIDFEKLPNQFVLKCTHDSGGLVICKDKSKLDIVASKKKLQNSLKTNFFLLGREWPYKNVPKKIIAEKYMTDTSSHSSDLPDYKFYCFNEEVKVVLVATNRFTSHNFNYVDADFNPISLKSTEGEPNKELVNKPECWDKMIEIARILSKGIIHVRVDLYISQGKIYFGELTFFDASGYDDFGSEEWNERLGSWIKLN
jgi:hypothetical protein